LNEPINQPLPSPVSTTSMTKQWILRMVFLAAMAAVIVSLLIHHFFSWKTKDDQPPLSSPTPVSTVLAPQLSAVQEQVKELKSVIETQKQAASYPSPEQEEAEKLRKMRMLASTTAYSVSSSNTSSTEVKTNASGNNPDNSVLGGNGRGDANTQFMAQLNPGSAPITNATHIAHPAETLAQGTMIWATLETRISSDLPGMVRAVTSEDIYGEEGSRILIPRGSRLIGQYTNAIAQGQRRVFVVWQRVIRPDHIDIQISSPGTDPLGTAGMGADSVNNHFVEQFSSAALLSLIGAGASNIGVHPDDQFNSASAYREALSNSFNQTAQNTMRNTGVIQPTLTINQGKKVSVFVARDLDFYNELNTTEGSIS
jgi:type IV secretion system protein VirB10